MNTRYQSGTSGCDDQRGAQRVLVGAVRERARVQHRIVAERLRARASTRARTAPRRRSQDAAPFEQQLARLLGQRLGSRHAGRRAIRHGLDRRLRRGGSSRCRFKHRALPLGTRQPGGSRTSRCRARARLRRARAGARRRRARSRRAATAADAVRRRSSPAARKRLRDHLPAVNPPPPEHRPGTEERVGLHLLQDEQRCEVGDGMDRDHGRSGWHRSSAASARTVALVPDNVHGRGIEHEAGARVGCETERDRREHAQHVTVAEAAARRHPAASARATTRRQRVPRPGRSSSPPGTAPVNTVQSAHDSARGPGSRSW